MSNTALAEYDVFGSPFAVGDEVLIRGIVTALTSASGATSGFGGSADSVVVLVDTNGLAGEKTGVSVTVSPVQCRRAQGATSGLGA